jgi:hypothetical protein
MPGPARAQDPIPPATEFAQVVTLPEAAQAGIVQLTPKGYHYGDSVAVDLTGARIPGHSVVATVRIEFLGEQKNGKPWPVAQAAAIENGAESLFGGLTGSDGTQVTIDVVATVRSGTDPKQGGTPGYHQIVLREAEGPKDDLMVVSDKPFGPNGEHNGIWIAGGNPATFAHEIGHLLGLPNRYIEGQADCVAGDKRYPLAPKLGPGPHSDAEFHAWLKKLAAAAEKLEKQLGIVCDIDPAIPPGHEKDLMAGAKGADSSFLTADIDGFVGAAGVRLRAEPGDTLLNKKPGEQNLAVGAPLDLFAARGATAHVDGLYAYCIDMERPYPGASGGFDVLEPASGAGLTNFGSLRAVLAEIGRRQVATPNPVGPPGALEAVWAVTDAQPPFSDDGASILAAAGVMFDPAQFTLTPHLDNPNAASPRTAVVTNSATLPSTPADTSPPPADLQSTARRGPKLLFAGVSPRRVGPGKRREVTLLTVVGHADASVQVRARRAGKGRKRPGRRVKEVLPVGPAFTTLRLDVRRPGRYRIKVKGDVRARLVLAVR